MTTFTALHRVLGRRPGPLTSEMTDAAVNESVAETTDLDFKRDLPPTANLTQTDFPKDVAAMANSGGGMIVYGVTEKDKRANGRVDVELSENHERTLQQAVLNAISPPVFGVRVDRLDELAPRSVAIIVPAAQEPPHLIYRNDYFGAPVRADADTAWLREPRIAAMYRARFNLHRDRIAELDSLYAQTVRGCDIDQRAWFVAAASPRSLAERTERMSRNEARSCFDDAADFALRITRDPMLHPLNRSVDLTNPRPGFRSWVVRTASSNEYFRALQASAAIGETGAVAFTAAVGARHEDQHARRGGSQIVAADLECVVADFLGLLRAAGARFGIADYDVQIGIEWEGTDVVRFIPGASGDLARIMADLGDTDPVHFVPVRTSLRADLDDQDYHRQAHDLALDCVHQGGINHTVAIPQPHVQS